MKSLKKAQKAARKRSAALDDLRPFFEASLDGIVIVDRERRYLYVNPSAETILGETNAELAGRDFLAATFPERMHQVMLGYFASTLGGAPGLWETTIVRPDGTERDVQFSNLEFELDGDRVIAAIIRDLTHDRLRARGTAAAAQVAATFTLDRPLDESLTALCGIVRDNSTAVAASAVLLTENGRLRVVGNVGQPPGYLEAMRQVWAESTPNFALPYLTRPEPTFVPDGRKQIAESEDYAPVHEILKSVPWESILFVPIVYRGQAVGALNTFYASESAPTDAEIHLIKTITNQASIAIENSRLLERANQRSEQLAALLNASAAVSSTLDLEMLMSSVLDQVSSIVDYSATSIMLVEDGKLEVVLARFGDGTRPFEGRIRFAVAHDSALWSSFLRGEVVRIADSNADTQHARELRRSLEGRRGFSHIRSWMGIPLRAHDRLLGVLSVSRSTPGYFTEEHAQLLQGLAHHAAYGIERARLFEEVERAAAETDALVRVASAMTFDQAPEQVLDLLAENVVSVTGAISCAVILIDASGQHLELAGTHNLKDGYIAAIESIWHSGVESPTIVAFRTREVQVVSNVTEATLAQDEYAPIHDFVRDTPWNAMVALPLVYRGEAVGTMNVYYPTSDHVVSDDEMAYLKALADQAAVAGANLRLFREGERRLRSAEALARGASAMTFHETPKAVLDQLAHNVLVVTGAVSAGIIVVDKERDQITEVGLAGIPDGYMNVIQELWNHGTRIVGFEAARTGQVVVANDLPGLSRDLEYLEPFREFTDANWETLVALPLTYRGESLGTLNVCYSKETPPADGDMGVLRALADQAAVTAANLGLFRESEERRRRAETLAQVATALASRNSIEDTLNMLTKVLVHTTGAVASSVTLIDQERGAFTLAGSYGLPESFTRVVRDAWSQGRTTLMTLAIESQEPRITRRGKQRFLEDPDYAEAWDQVRDEPWEPVALAPMVYRGRTVGLLGAFYLPDQPPGPDDVSLLMAVAGQAAIAVENRRLFVETERRLRQVEAVSTIASNITFDQPLHEMLQSIAQSVIESTGAIACSLTRIDESLAVPLRITAMAGLPDGYQEALQDAYDHGAPSVIVNAYREREAMIIHNSRDVTLADPRFARAAALVEREPWNCIGVIPIVYREEALGLLVGYYPAREEPSNEEMAYLSAIADQAAIAIKNASLIEQAQESAAVSERQRLARELHDSVSQALYGIALGARTARTLLDRDPPKAVEPVDYVLQLAQAGLAEMRALIFQLRPESLAQEGLVAALDKEVAATSARYGLQVEAELGDEPPVPLEIKEAAYRIGQESMHNTVKHAKAARIWLSLGYRDGTLHLDVRDDGKGFDSSGQFPGHLGLRSMRERAARVGGVLELEAAPGQGTHISLRIPVPAGAEPHMPASMQAEA